MRLLSDEVLVESYHSAIRLHLDVEFIRLLAYEIKRRKLVLQITHTKKSA